MDNINPIQNLIEKGERDFYRVGTDLPTFEGCDGWEDSHT